MNRLVKFFFLIFAFMPTISNAVVIYTEASLLPNGPVLIDSATNDTIQVKVDFGTSFDSINFMYFTFNFGTNDLFDPNDQFRIGPLTDSNGGIRFLGGNNILDTSFENFSFALTGGIHPEVDYFLDGLSIFTFEMISGSLILESISITVDGEASSVPEPSSLLLFIFAILVLGLTHLQKHRSQA